MFGGEGLRRPACYKMIKAQKIYDHSNSLNYLYIHLVNPSYIYKFVRLISTTTFPFSSSAPLFRFLHHPLTPTERRLIMLNSVVLAGNLGGNPEIHFSTAGEQIASFSVRHR
jgi:hypothetical protein